MKKGCNVKKYYELIRDWENPLTTYPRGHFNGELEWADMLGISKKDFIYEMSIGTFDKWFKLHTTPYTE